LKLKLTRVGRIVGCRRVAKWRLIAHRQTLAMLLAGLRLWARRSRGQVLLKVVKKTGTQACSELIFVAQILRTGGVMRCTVVLEFDDGDSTALRRVELTRLYRDVADPKPGDLGLSLPEGKTLLQTVRQEFATAQIQQFCELRRTCRACGASRRRHEAILRAEDHAWQGLLLPRAMEGLRLRCRRVTLRLAAEELPT
jgi:hypothetical protein